MLAGQRVTSADCYLEPIGLENRVSTELVAEMKNTAKSFDKLTLDKLQVGVTKKISAVLSANTLLRNKLMSMGVVSGASVSISHVAPFGDPINVKILGSSLALRRSEAAAISLSDE